MDTLRHFISKIDPKKLNWKRLNSSYLFHFFVILVALVPLFLFSCYFLQKDKLLREGDMKIQTLIRGAEKTAILRKKQADQIKQYAASDPLYVQKQIESYAPLQLQVETLSALIANEALSGCFYWQNRLADLVGDKNLIKFHPSEKKVVKNIQESVLELMMPVQVSDDDLKRLLSKIEGVKIGPYLPPNGRPDLLIKKLALERKNIGHESQVFELNMELIKREGTRI